MTVEGAERLKAELQRLKTVERPAVIQAIAEARSHGDLSENAEYDAAKERQGFIEGRIAEVEAKLAHAQVIDPAAIEADGRVVFGATVELEDLRAATARPTRSSATTKPTSRRQDLHQLADRPRADRQDRRRHRGGAGARRHAQLRGARRPLRLTRSTDEQGGGRRINESARPRAPAPTAGSRGRAPWRWRR